MFNIYMHNMMTEQYVTAFTITGLIMLLDLFLVLFSLMFLFVLCGELSWLLVRFSLHVKCTVSYRIVHVSGYV